MTTIEQAFIECVLADLAYVGTLTKGMPEDRRTAQFARRKIRVRVKFSPRASVQR